MRNLLLTLLLFCLVASTPKMLPYKNAALPIATRVEDLLNRMTPEEKFFQLFMVPGEVKPGDSSRYQHGIFGLQVSAGAGNDAGGQLLTYNTTEGAKELALKINRIQKHFVENTRLGIPMIPFDEALHGLVRGNATAFPQAIALAATWDTALMHQVATAIAKDARSRGIRDVLTPVVNVATDPRWGRTEETYGEDPLLTSAIGVAFVSAFEQNGVITTPKHFILNHADGGRDSYPAYANNRQLKEIYLPPFEACFKQGGSRSVMTAYNSLDGTACSANADLLLQTLKKDIGFKGFVISDANAVGGAVVLHGTADTYEESGRQAIMGGLDVIFQTDYDHYKLFIAPFLDGRIDTARINDAVRRVLTAKFELGLFEKPYVSEKDFLTDKDVDVARNLSTKAAEKSIVLMKNSASTLPIPSSVKSIAVIGEDAVAARLGGYSGSGNQKISILDGLKSSLGKSVSVKYAKGCGIQFDTVETIPATAFKGGFKAEYFNNISWSGTPILTRTDEKIDFHWTLFGPGKGLNAGFYSVRWTGVYQPEKSGNQWIGLEGNDGFELIINGKSVLHQPKKLGYHRNLVEYDFKAGQSYQIEVKFYEPLGNGFVKLIRGNNGAAEKQRLMKEAMTIAKSSEHIIVVAGIHEGEFQDRASLHLPGYQSELIRALKSLGKPVTVVLVGGSAIIMDDWIDSADAVLMSWYAGETGGLAIADVLTGKVNPSGKLPITFPAAEAQLPLVYNHKPTGRGDDYYNLSGEPAFPFGFGLSYASFEYRNLTLKNEKLAGKDSVELTFEVKNTSSISGEEVTQVYLRNDLASVALPVQQLVAFQRVQLNAGETKQVRIVLSAEAFQYFNADMKKVTEPQNKFRLMVGSSCKDIRLEHRWTY